MRRDVEELRDFYASPLGRAAREMVAPRITGAWGDAAASDVLLWGYAAPYAAGLTAARRVVAAMPAQQGVEPWPAGGRNRACLVAEDELPFADASFDRVLLAHLLEEADAGDAVLREATRVLTASGRLVIVAASRAGVWSHVESTPFGHGRPYSRGQLERAVRAAGLEPTAWSRALYVPPWTPLAGVAGLWESVGERLWPTLSGLVMLEAAKRTFAVTPVRVRERVRVRMRPALVPAAAPAPASRGLAADTLCGIGSASPRRSRP